MSGLRSAGALARLLSSLLLLAACAVARASCIESPDPVIRGLQALAVSEPYKALARADAMLADAQASHAGPQEMAWLHAIRAHSYSALELDATARSAAADGMKLVPDHSSPVGLALFTIDAENIYDAEGIAEAKQRVEAARAARVGGAEGELCLLITLGTLQARENRADLAIVTLTQAYRSSDMAGKLMQRSLAASQLSKVMRDLGDYRQALALNSEVIEWNASHHETLTLSVTRYLRGIILHEIHEYNAAMLAFANARALSVMLHDEQGIAFADMRICEVLIDLGDHAGARQRCQNALRIFAASGTIDVVKQTRADLARIDIAEGHAARALVTLDDILANGATDMPPREVAPLFKARADANAALGKLDAAYADLGEYTRRYTVTNEARRVRQVEALRARFETDREIERNASLQRELGEAKQRELQLRRRTLLAVSAGTIAVVLLTAWLIGARAHRRQLAALANLDALTGLPNRRHTAQLATAALERCGELGQPLTIALIDLDHFKTINDRSGHAGGDQVLREFARLSRGALRASDTIGRWGGEEFLLAMPGATLDVAMAVVERLRTLAMTIEVPGCADTLRVSLSAGLAVNELPSRSLDSLVARADVALYRAKHDGRNTVRVDEQAFDAGPAEIRRGRG